MPSVYTGPIRKIDNNGGGATSIIYVPTGVRYKNFRLRITDGTAATLLALYQLITEIRIRWNTKVQRQFSGPQLYDFLALMGSQFMGALTGTRTAVIPIDLAEPWRIEGDQEALAWPTQKSDLFQIEVQLATGNSPSISCTAEWDDVSLAAGNLPSIVKWTRAKLPASSTKFDAPQLSTIVPATDRLQQVSIYPDSTNKVSLITNGAEVLLKINGADRYDQCGDENVGRLAAAGMYPAAAGRGDTTGSVSTGVPYDMVIDGDGLLSSSIPMNQVTKDSLTISNSSAMGGNMDTIIQHWGPPA